MTHIKYTRHTDPIMYLSNCIVHIAAMIIQNKTPAVKTQAVHSTSAAGTCRAETKCVGVLYLGQGEGQWQQKVERVRVSVALDDAQWHHHVFVEHHETAERRAHQQTVVLRAHARHLTLRR